MEATGKDGQFLDHEAVTGVYFVKHEVDLMIVRLTLLFTFLLILPAFSEAQILNDRELREAVNPVIEEIYNLEHVAASGMLEELALAYPADPAIPLLQALNQFWKAELSQQDQFTHAYILAQLEEAMDKNAAFESGPSTRSSYHFVAFMAHALEARLWLFEEEDWRAVNAARKVLDHLDPIIEMAEGSPELSLIAGLYHYYAIAYPRDKAYLKPFMAFFPEGNIELGLQELLTAGSEPNMGQAQALYYLTDIYLYEERNAEKAIANAGKLHRLFPGNTWFHADYIRTLIFAGKYTLAEQECLGILDQFYRLSDNHGRVITSRESPYTSQLMMRIYHYLGRIAYHRDQDAGKAKDWFWNSRTMVRLSDMERDAYTAANAYYIGLCEDKLGNRETAIHYYEEALDHPENGRIEDAAERCLEQPCTE